MHGKIVIDKKTVICARFLFVISIMLIIYGLFLDFQGTSRLFDPIKDVTVSDVTNTKSKSNVDVDSINNGNKTDESNNQIQENNSSNTQNNISEADAASNLDLVNSRLRNQLQKKYSVEIKYGAETSKYVVGNLETTSITNQDDINKALTKLDKVLSHYPDGMFEEIKNGGIPLTIYLVERFSQTGITGVTDSNAYFANISVATAYPFEESFYHESYHYIERYMNERKKYYYNSWDNYNPPGFTYGENANPELAYVSNGGDEKSYFVNNYAQSADAEDRASTFEYMMSQTKASCLNKDQPVWKKAKAMAQAIDASLDTCSPNIVDYWERFL